MFGYMRAFGWPCCFFFLVVFIFTNFVLVNLFVAVILENFKVEEDKKLKKQERLYWEAERRRGREVPEPDELTGQDKVQVAGWGGGWVGLFLASSEEQALGTEKRLQEFLAAEAASLVTNATTFELEDGELSPREKFLASPLRTLARYSSGHYLFETLIIAAILLSSISLAVEGPPDADYLQPHPELRAVLEVTDVTFFIIFWVECVLKVVGNGFGFPFFQDGAYLSDGWNRLDFTVVFFTTIDFVLRYVAPGTDAGWARIFRMLRVLRPLRIVSKYENIRVIIDSIIESISGVTATVLLAFFFIVIFAIVGLNLFSGKFWSCQEEPSLTRLECEAAGLSIVLA